MKNITLSIQEDLLEEGRNYARKHNISLNALIRQLLEKNVRQANQDNWLKECFQLAENAKGNSKGKQWKREDLYDV